jgi:hypothetical protein
MPGLIFYSKPGPPTFRGAFWFFYRDIPGLIDEFEED